MRQSFRRVALARRRAWAAGALSGDAMDVTELYLKLKSLSAAIRARNWVAIALVLRDLAGPALDWLAHREQEKAEGHAPAVMMACPCDLSDLDALADWCEAQGRLETSAVGASAFPWPLVLPILQALLERLLGR